MKKHLFALLCCLKVISAVIYKLSDEEYDLMPPVFKTDPYDSCLKEPRGVYCTAYLTYVSDDDSPLLHMMQEYSAHTATHYNHTRALYGICITKKCNHLYENKTKNDLTTVLEACLNETLWEEYKLKAITEEMSCTIKDEDEIEIYWSHIIVAGICGSIVLLNFVGTLYDICDFKKYPGIVSHLLLCFSIPRNWERLTAPPATIGDPRLRTLVSLNGMRAITMTLTITSHVLVPVFLLPRSPKFIESVYLYNAMHLFLNGTLVMQTFFIISALLLTYKLLLLSEKRQLTWSLLPMAIWKRWLRLTPPFAVVIALTVTWFKYLGSGPIWDKTVGTECRACESDWWHQILYFNNYVDKSPLCMLQMWYLAADTHLYILGIIVFIVCQTVSPKKVLSILFVIGVIIPGVHTYLQDLDGIVIVSPSTATSFFTSNPTFNVLHKRSHTNLPGYVIGIAGGYLLYHLQMKNFDISKYKVYRPLYWSMAPITFMVVLSCKAYYGDVPRFGLFHRVLVSATLKPLFAISEIIFIIGMTFKYESVYRSILEWRGWTSVSRASYSMYLVHIPVIKVMIGLQMEPIPGTFLRFIEFLVCAMTLIFFVGYLFWLTVESPLGQLAKISIEGVPKQDSRQEEKKLN